MNSTEQQPTARQGPQKSLPPVGDDSAGSRPTREMHSQGVKKDPFIGVFPTSIWSRILPQVHPFQLLRISPSSRSLHSLITANDTILRRSRMEFMPDIPEPVLDISEAKLLDLINGFGCQKCSSQTATTCWAFRARLCHSCMMKHSEKVNSPGWIMRVQANKVSLGIQFGQRRC